MAEQTTNSNSSNNETNNISIQTSTTEDKSLGNVLGGFYKKDPVSEEIDKEVVRAFGDDIYVQTEEG